MVRKEESESHSQSWDKFRKHHIYIYIYYIVLYFYSVFLCSNVLYMLNVCDLYSECLIVVTGHVFPVRLSFKTNVRVDLQKEQCGITR